jgi:small-conductance mechanosensitive channel
MKDSAIYESSSLPIPLPELSLQVISLLQIGFYLALSTLSYYLARRILLAMGNTGALEKRTLTFQFFNISTFILPALIFLFGLTSVSQDSLFVSLLFFVVFSIVVGFSLVAPSKSILAALLITIRGDLRVGDYITMGDLEGEIANIGAFNILILGKNGSRTFIPTHQLLNEAYEVHAKKGGPSIMVNIPSDKISKRNLERLAHLCAFKRKGSDIRISTMEGQHRLSIEIVNREARPWVQKYFEKHLQ